MWHVLANFADTIVVGDPPSNKQVTGMSFTSSSALVEYFSSPVCAAEIASCSSAASVGGDDRGLGRIGDPDPVTDVARPVPTIELGPSPAALLVAAD